MPEEKVVKYGDVSQRVGVEVIRARGVDVQKLIKMLIANAAAEFASTYYYYTILRMHLAGYEDYKEICEDARLEDRAHWELIVPRIYELGGSFPTISRLSMTWPDVPPPSCPILQRWSIFLRC